ncbi:MAG: CofH family radical SAM protein [Verrucomicrobia bacterium]|nr:CofH family radical SAM protein [Verrucomicrobiota bacterium]
MKCRIEQRPFAHIYDKAQAGGRVTRSEALELIESVDINGVGAIAETANRRMNAGRASYILNCHINYSNYCRLGCRFCAFSRRAGEDGGFRLSVSEIVDRASKWVEAGITELHIVGGLDPELPFSYYLDLLRELKQLGRGLTLKCFTSIEVLHFARISGRSVEEVLSELKAAGLDMLTGGGAEIFNPEVRRLIAADKESAREYLETHRAWHEMGGRSTCTMLYGHLETLEDRIEHLLMLRRLQDETGGFVGFVPLPYQPHRGGIPVAAAPSGFDSLRTIAVSRIILDNFRHITAYWIGLGTRLAQLALSYGADDLHGTLMDEKIFHMAGATSPEKRIESEMVAAIRQAGKMPAQRDSFYEPLRIWE